MPSYKEINENNKAAILALRRQTLNLRAISERVGFSKSVIKIVLKHYEKLPQSTKELSQEPSGQDRFL